jgi:hypothetical protein
LDLLERESAGKRLAANMFDRADAEDMARSEDLHADSDTLDYIAAYLRRLRPGDDPPSLSAASSERPQTTDA